MTNQELTPETAAVIEKVEKLMRLAGKNPNEHEAAAAMAKAQEMLAAHNLDLSIIEQGGGEKATRSDEKMTGGLYHYQRELWEAVAELNFCMYWHQQTWDKTKKTRRKNRWGGGTYIKEGGYRFEHRVVGRKVNVIATRNMAQYLEQTIERITRERLNGDGTQFFTRWAISFREGLAYAVVEKIEAERDRILNEEKKKARAAEKRAKEAGMAGQRFMDYTSRGQRPIVFHFGDHDPSGIDMTEDNRRRLEMFAGVPVIVQRLALNMNQIQQYNPPPNPAKETDSRFANYESRYGDKSWELDALDPEIIQNLIRDAVLKIRDPEKWKEMVEQEVQDLRTMEAFIEDMGRME